MDVILACACHATAFEWRPGGIAIDVRAGPPPDGSPFEIAAELPATAQPTEAILPLLPERRVLAWLGPAPGPEEAPPVGLAEPQAAVLAAVAGAAAQGLLAPSPMDLPSDQPAVEPAPRELVVTVQPSPDTEDRLQLLLDSLPDEIPGLSARTSQVQSPELATEDETAYCPPDERFSPYLWVEGPDFSAQIGGHRATLWSETGALNVDSLTDLARTYIAFGFGQEALSTLALDQTSSHEKAEIQAMAALIEGQAPPEGLLSGLAACVGAVAPWSALSDGTLVDRPPEALIAVARELRLWPKPLQQVLAPRLAALFLAAGEPEMAAGLLDAAPGPGPADQARAPIESAIVQTVAGPDAALDVLQSADPALAETDEALIETARLSRETGRPVSDETLDLLAARLFEQRGTPEAGPLSVALIAAALGRGDVDRALRTLAEADPPLSPTVNAEQRNDIAMVAAERLSDSAFSAVVASGRLPLAEGMAANAVARRLIRLGFTDSAREWLSTPADGPAAIERPYLQAEAAIAAGLPDLARASLGELSDPRAAALRARAFVLDGSPGLAIASVESSPGALVDTRMAFQAGDWRNARFAEEPLIAEAVERALADPPALLEATPLASRTALLDEASATRQLAQDLIARFSTDATGN
jgi:hypothetical protein